MLAMKKGGAHTHEYEAGCGGENHQLIPEGNYLQDAGRDAAICILVLAKSAKITERNAARQRRGRRRGEIFAGSREGEGETGPGK